MKKKLEAELISIAHRILKLKNRAELDQLQQETLKLYEKISVLRFVEDNFSDVKPTIGHASAEEALEEIYGLEEQPEVHGNEQEAKEEKAREEKAKAKNEDAEKAKGKSEEPKAETPVAEKEAVEETEAEEAKEEEPKTEDKKEKPAKEEEPEVKIQVEKPAEEVKAMEEGAAAVFEKEDQSTIEEEEKAADAEVVTIEPDAKAKVEDTGLSFDFAFEREAAPEEPAKQKEITFEDYKDYKEPEFIKKEDVDAPKQAEKPKAETPQEPETEKTEEQEASKEPGVRDWRDWEPSKSPVAEEAPKEEEKKDEPKQETPKVEEPVEEAPKAEEPKQESTVKGNIATRADFERPKSLNDALGKSISLGLNDRIAFEKHLFGGSTDDLNRVLSQLNTINTFDEAKDFINELVKPDYNDWKGKEDYEERFMEIVEKKFN